MKENIYIRKIPLPYGVRAFTLPDEQGDFNIYINSKLSAAQQQLSLSHEVQHILNSDFQKELTACEIERAMKNQPQ